MADVWAPCVEIAGGDAEVVVVVAFDGVVVACVDDVDVVDGIAGVSDADALLDSRVDADDGKDEADVGAGDDGRDGDRWEECFDGCQVDGDVEGADDACADEAVVVVQVVVVGHSRACC